ncbi:MAG: hypothetical protein ACE5E1_06710 [Phycisphaerae bacterium]
MIGSLLALPVVRIRFAFLCLTFLGWLLFALTGIVVRARRGRLLLLTGLRGRIGLIVGLALVVTFLLLLLLLLLLKQLLDIGSGPFRLGQVFPRVGVAGSELQRILIETDGPGQIVDRGLEVLSRWMAA